MTMFTSSTSSTFESFLLKRGIIKALNEVNITTPYYHQREALPSALLGQDIILQSKSGNGKTLVAVLATLMDDYPNSCTGISTLWISHTRELVIQIQAQFVNLSKHLSQFDVKQVIIFTKTQIRAHYLQKELTKICFPAMCMHGSIDQVSRFQIWRDFNHNGRILIATDLMGRGIDLNKVNLVINFDMAQSCEEYLHRIGRASRCNTRGSAISFVAELQEKQLIQTIEQKFVVKVNTIKENDMKGLNDNFLY
eukprot:119150_1